MRMLVFPEFKDLFETSTSISCKYTFTSNMQNFMASFLELWNNASKDDLKKKEELLVKKNLIKWN